MPAKPPIPVAGASAALLLALTAPLAWATPGEELAGTVEGSPFAEADPALAPPAEEAPPAVDGTRWRAVFGDALRMRTDRLLEGVDATEDIVFTVPSDWELLEDPLLTLNFDHSSALIPERSHLTVTVNDHPVQSVTLDARNGVGGVIQARIPRDALQAYNHVEVRAIQHVSHHCEDPFDPSLWTRVRKDSWVEFAYARKDVKADLSRFPFPFYDETGYGPVEFAVLTGERPSPATVASAGRIGLALGRVTPYRDVVVADPVRDVAKATTHAVVVGLPQENPQVEALLGPVGLKPSQGLVAMVPNPADPSLVVLVVTGADAEGLARATAAVTGKNRGEVLAGTRTIVDEALASDPPPTARIPRPAPPRDSYTLADLGLSDQTVRGFSSPALRVPLGLEGDAVVRPGGASARIEYAYAARLDPRLSAVEVRVDGVTVKTAPLEDTDGSTRSTLDVDIPEGLMRPDAAMEVVFHVFPKDFDACQYISDRTLWATLYATSTLEVERDHVAELPDLGRLRYGAWPFTMEPGKGGVVAALPDVPSPEDVAAGVQLAAWLGQSTAAEAPEFRLAPASEVSFGGSPDANFILLASGAPHALYDRLARGGDLVLTGADGRQLVDDTQRVLVGAQVDTTYGTIEEALSPSNADRAVLVVSAPDRGSLPEVVRALADADRVRQLEGNVAVLGPEGGVRTLQIAQKHQVGSFAVGASMQLLVRKHWMFLGLGLIGGAFLLTAVKRAWARGKNER